MSRNRFTQVGLDRIVRLHWLERVAMLLLAGNLPDEIKTILQTELQPSFQSGRTDVRGSLDKTITILIKVWLSPPSELEGFRLAGLELMKDVPQKAHLPVHWGMLTAVYPFWSAVATQTGRLLRLQCSAAAVQVQRRIKEQYGERETVSRRARYVLRSYLDWGVLQETGAKGIYSAGATLAVDDSRLIAWLAEASLHARANGSAPLKDLIDSPSFFPFRIKPVHAESLLAASSRLDAIRHGLDEDLLLLRSQKPRGRAL